ncbi:hypothetical protein [uncultured Marinobacter sp.]|uniref:hypothetical protein n=1 Tax=uncultured Marinobacter sp. TaxID=187379 RepID=UPI002583894B|nr:hypothetical protein [uncultured Marinobacter sp.]
MPDLGIPPNQRADYFSTPNSPYQLPIPDTTIPAPAPEPAFDPSYIDPNQAFQGDQGASELFGKLNRARWEDWKARFAPYVDRLAEMATDPNAPAEAASQASSAMGTAFDAAQTVSQQNREAYGLSMSPEQQQAQDRAAKVNRAAATVSAGNEARISAQDRQQAILAGGMGLSSIPNEVMNQ